MTQLCLSQCVTSQWCNHSDHCCNHSDHFKQLGTNSNRLFHQVSLEWCQLNALQASPVVHLVTPLSCVSLSMNTQPSVPAIEMSLLFDTSQKSWFSHGQVLWILSQTDFDFPVDYYGNLNRRYYLSLTHRVRDEMTAILQMISPNAFSGIKVHEFH